MNRFYLIFGLFSGLSSLALQFLYYNGNMSLDKGGMISILIVALLFICVVFSAIAYKKEQGEVGFMRVVFGGFLVALISTIPSVIWYNTTYLINQDFFEPVKEYRLESWKKKKAEDDQAKKQQGIEVTPLTKKEIEDSLHRIEQGTQPGYYTITYLIMNMVIAVVTSLLVAAFIAKKTEYT